VSSFGARSGFTGYFDTTSPIEVDGSGNPGIGEGWWKPANGSTLSGTA
jgi:hypothetical protein